MRTNRSRSTVLKAVHRGVGAMALGVGCILLASACFASQEASPASSGAGPSASIEPAPSAVPTPTPTPTPTPSPSPTPEPGADITDASVQSLLMPAGSCGSGSSVGWNQPYAIQLVDGNGEFYDDSGMGAGIISTTLVGAADMNEDGAMDAVLMLDCTGTPFVDCCAGRTSTLHAAVVVDVSDRFPALIGEALFGAYQSPDAEPHEIQEVAVTGKQILTHETFVYPENLDPAVVAANEGWIRYALVDGHWQPTEP